MKITLDLDTECFKNGYCHDKLYFYDKYCATYDSYKKLMNYIEWSYKTELVRNLYNNNIDILKLPIIINNEVVLNGNGFAHLYIDLNKLFTLYVTLLLDKSRYNNYDTLFIGEEEFKTIIKYDSNTILNNEYTISLNKDSFIYIKLTIVYKPTIKQSFIQSTSVIEVYRPTSCICCGTKFETNNCPICGLKRSE